MEKKSQKRIEIIILTADPKSGEEQDHIAPILAVASKASNVSIQFGM
jgi:hypothetical protein